MLVTRNTPAQDHVDSRSKGMKLSVRESQWKARGATYVPFRSLTRTKKALSLEGGEDLHCLICRGNTDS